MMPGKMIKSVNHDPARGPEHGVVYTQARNPYDAKATKRLPSHGPGRRSFLLFTGHLEVKWSSLLPYDMRSVVICCMTCCRWAEKPNAIARSRTLTC
jgi:hypothetical protein